MVPEYWHLLSLDAPTVAALWAWSIARALQLSLAANSLLLLFAGTWLLYVADRILDGFHADRARLHERHFFYLRHRTAALAAALPVAIVVAWLALAHMLPRARGADLALFSLAAAYFALVHLRGRATERWFPKELLVALIAAAAIAVPAWSRLATPTALSCSILAAATLLFAAVCWLNCLAIERWEQDPGSHVPITDRTTRWGQRRLRPISAAIALAASLAAAAFLCCNQFPAALLSLAAAASAALLAALDQTQSQSKSRSPIRPSAFHLRIAADLALLTPVLLIILR
ncbi:MAG: hypothetical protein WAM66_09150 [Acidobacteriaceae bacterium]